MDLGIINFALYIIREKGYYKDGEKAEYLAEVMEKIKIACQNVNDPQYYNQYRDDWYHP